MFEYSHDPPPLDTTVAVMLFVWGILLLPLWLFAGFVGSGIAGGGNPSGGETLAKVALTYPILLGVAFFYRRRKPRLVWLPGLSLLLVVSVAIFYG